MSRRRRAQALIGGGIWGLGVALGAASQREVYLDPAADLARGASGTLIPLTAALGGIGVLLLLLAKWPAPNRRAVPRRFAIAAGAAGAAAIAQMMVQTSFPNVDVVVDARRAILSIAPLINNNDGNPALLIVPFAAMVGLFAAARAGIARLRTTATTSTTPAASAPPLVTDGLVVAFLAVAAAGHMRLLSRLAEIPSGLTITVSTVAVASALIAAGAIAGRNWQRAAWRQATALAPAHRENHRVLITVETIALAGLAAAALLATALPTQPHGDLELGRVVGTTLRGFGQGTAAILLLALPAHFAARRRQDAMDLTAATPGAPLAPPTANAPWLRHPATAVIAPTITVMLGIAAGLAAGGALIAWVAVLLPTAWAAWRGDSALVAARTSAAAGAARLLPAGLLALALWGTGNTIAARYTDLDFSGLVLAEPAAISLLLRLLAATLAAAVATAALRPPARNPAAADARRIAWHAVAVGTLAALLMLEGTFTIWTQPGTDGLARIGIGSLSESLPTAAAWTLHILTIVAAAAVAYGVVTRRDGTKGTLEVTTAAPVETRAPAGI